MTHAALALKPLLISLPAALGLAVLFCHVLWRLLRWHFLGPVDAALNWQEEAAISRRRAPQSKLLMSVVQRESRRARERAQARQQQSQWFAARSKEARQAA